MKLSEERKLNLEISEDKAGTSVFEIHVKETRLVTLERTYCVIGDEGRARQQARWLYSREWDEIGARLGVTIGGTS